MREERIVVDQKILAGKPFKRDALSYGDVIEPIEKSLSLPFTIRQKFRGNVFFSEIPLSGVILFRQPAPPLFVTTGSYSKP